MTGTSLAQNPSISQTLVSEDISSPTEENLAPRGTYGNINALLHKHTEVPNAYRTHPIEISVAVRNMPRTVRLLSSGLFHAAVFVETPGDDSPRAILRTETLELDTFPSFCKKGWMHPLDMRNSLEYAEETSIRVELYSGTKFIGSAQTTLAMLVAAQPSPLPVVQLRGKYRGYTSSEKKTITPQVILNAESYLCSSGRVRSRPFPANGSISHRGSRRSASEDPSFSEETSVTGDDTVSSLSLQPAVRFDVGVAGKLIALGKLKQISFSISRANRAGDWTAVYRSGTKFGRPNTYPPAEIHRDVLLAGEEGRQLRIALHSFDQTQGSRVEGWVIFRLEELESIHKDGAGRAANLQWTKMPGNTMNAGIEFRRMDLECDRSARIQLLFKHGEDVAEEQAAALAESSIISSTGEEHNTENSCDFERPWSQEQGFSNVTPDTFSRSGSNAIQTTPGTAGSRERSISSTGPGVDGRQGTTVSSSDGGASSARISRPTSLYLPSEPTPTRRTGFLFRKRRPESAVMEVRFPGEN